MFIAIIITAVITALLVGVITYLVMKSQIELLKLSMGDDFSRLQGRLEDKEDDYDFLASREAALAGRFKNPAVQSDEDVWNAFHSMEGRALAAEAMLKWLNDNLKAGHTVHLNWHLLRGFGVEMINNGYGSGFYDPASLQGCLVRALESEARDRQLKHNQHQHTPAPEIVAENESLDTSELEAR